MVFGCLWQCGVVDEVHGLREFVVTCSVLCIVEKGELVTLRSRSGLMLPMRGELLLLPPLGLSSPLVLGL